MKDREKLQQEILAQLPYFTGSEQMWEHNTPIGKLLLTDGCNFVREKCEARWLFDLIQSHQPKLKKESFQTWTIEKIIDIKFLVTCTDGDETTLVAQQIHSDFPLNSLTVWLSEDTCLLLSEY